MSTFSHWRIAICAVGLSCSSVAPSQALDLTAHSFSRTKQFVVYAREGAVRGAVCTLGDDIKEELLGILGLRDEWKLPIVVNLRAPEPGLPDARPPVRLQLAQTGMGLKVELDLLTGEGGRGTRIRDELVRAILLDLGYRHALSLPPGRVCTLPPPWLVEGFSTFLENEENGVSASLFGALLPTIQTMSPTDFLGKDPGSMDSTSQAVYRACSYNLVCLLLRELPGGRQGLTDFLRGLPGTSQADADSATALGKYFPELAASPDALAKWWALGLARLADSDRYQIFSVEETERRLAAMLTVTVPGNPKTGEPPKTCALEDFEKFASLRQNANILEPLRIGLAGLSAQAAPLYQAIVRGYVDVVTRLDRNHVKGVVESLHALAEARRGALKQRSDIADYVNWYEATQVATKSDAFNDYFQAARQVDLRQKIHRPDAISAYLDSLDTEFQ